MTANQLTYQANKEKERANRRQEEILAGELAERQRTNKANESIKKSDVDVKSRDVAVKEKKSQSEIDLNNAKAAHESVQTVTEGLKTTAQLIDAVIPG